MVVIVASDAVLAATPVIVARPAFNDPLKLTALEVLVAVPAHA